MLSSGADGEMPQTGRVAPIFSLHRCSRKGQLEFESSSAVCCPSSVCQHRDKLTESWKNKEKHCVGLMATFHSALFIFAKTNHHSYQQGDACVAFWCQIRLSRGDQSAHETFQIGSCPSFPSSPAVFMGEGQRRGNMISLMIL